jgi:hypothetical protein
MRFAAWGAIVVLALLWTGGAWMTAEAAQWAVQALSSGTVVDAGRELARSPLPPALAIWIDPAWVEAMRSLMLGTLDAGVGLLPVAGAAAGWLVPLVWVVWAFGLLFLLLLGLGTELLLRRFSGGRQPA